MYNSDEIVENYEKNWDNCIRWTFGIPEDTPNAKELAAKIKAIYFPEKSNLTKDQKLEQFTKMFSDAYFLLHLNHCISVQSQFSPIYPYYFNRRGGPSFSVIVNLLTSKGSLPVKIAKHVAAIIYNKITGNKPRDYGVCHTDDIAMLFKISIIFNVDFATDPALMTFRGVAFPKPEPGKRLQYLELCENPKMIDEPFQERVNTLKPLDLIKLCLPAATQ
ncbi:unnamed protein product [Allacma fusca]|uniref:Carboxylesterase type B domain-containing protein n=1 Tax=Allacma fusca TaxID=39272 RepID=A0A8J2KD07_9HEXA|nr:unnamed protein product [Allacma fusca]